MITPLVANFLCPNDIFEANEGSQAHRINTHLYHGHMRDIFPFVSPHNVHVLV